MSHGLAILATRHHLGKISVSRATLPLGLSLYSFHPSIYKLCCSIP